MDTAVALYSTADHPSLQTIANELDLNPIKVRKLLITAGVYKSEIADQVNRVFTKHRAFGLSHTEAIAATMRELNLSKASVTSYLPYEKGVYFPNEADSSNISVGAERIRRMRNREKILEELCDCRFPGRLFVTAPTNHRQHPGRTWAPLLAYARQCLLAIDVYVMYQIPIRTKSWQVSRTSIDSKGSAYFT